MVELIFSDGIMMAPAGIVNVAWASGRAGWKREIWNIRIGLWIALLLGIHLDDTWDGIKEDSHNERRIHSFE